MIVLYNNKYIHASVCCKDITQFNEFMHGVLDMDCMSNFSKLLKELRESKGLKQSDLAEKLGVSRGSISFYENGDRVPDIVFLHKMAEFFGVSCDYLLGFVDDSVFDADDRAISEATGLSGLAISILRQTVSNRLADILNLLIEQEYVTTPIAADTLEKYPCQFSNYAKDVLKGFEEEVQYMLAQEDKAQWESEVDMRDSVEDVVKERRIREWAERHYYPILSRLYTYLIEWDKLWLDDLGKPIYFLENGDVQRENPLREFWKTHDTLHVNAPKCIAFPQNKMIDSALLLDIQDSIRELKIQLFQEAQKRQSKRTAPGATNTGDVEGGHDNGQH